MDAASSHAFPHLNILRGFAALTVLVYHVIELGKWSDFPAAHGMWWFRTGWMAVDLFIVLSGFVITRSLLQWQEKGISYSDICKGFMQRRLWRIAPLYILTGACFVLMQNPLSWAVEPNKRDCILHYLTFTQSYDDDCFGAINGVSWSVALEVQFYVLIALTLPLWRKFAKRPWLLWIGIWLFALACKDLTWSIAQEKGWPPFEQFIHMIRLPVMVEEFACGMLLALWRKPLSVIILAVIAGLFGSILFSLYFEHHDYWKIYEMNLFWRTGLAIFFTLIVAIAITLPPLKHPNFLYRIGTYLGDISYGIYLWQLMVIYLLQGYFGLIQIPLLLGTLGVSLLLSVLTWHFLEKPLIEYGRQRSKALNY